MSTARPLITVGQRRARLQRRHLLLGEPVGSVQDVVSSVVALHATCPPTVYLSMWARRPGSSVADLDDALYRRRSLIRQLAMRRTMFVVDRATLTDAVSCVGARVAASERTNILRDLRRDPTYPDPDGWLDAAATAVVTALAAGLEGTSTQLREAIVEIGGRVATGSDSSMPIGPRVLNMLSAAGAIVRGTNTVGWHQFRPCWAAMDRWLPSPLQLRDPATGHREMVRRWLQTFGPGTETDIVWWLGSTKTAVRAALAEVQAVAVDVETGDATTPVATGYLLPDDLDPVEPVPPRAVLLPELDPATMGWKQRDFYLAPHAGHLFDRNGNGGQTAWWDGRVVGGWYLRPGGGVALHLLEPLPAAAVAQLRSRAAQLDEWLGDIRPKPGYPAPFHATVS
ncbi:winged helix DNA-binding domain-containing protein [Williamsia sp. CHRR-6]|uniref:winged helix DNA-binding domain-containing protein n=1 Tax=Williamsia sp. CHRR-6 TaxID=2835871 RepID=UPI001BD9D808|nr:winged helix DNA-binding domain-containing protein [Williamsia sp. CHRR-6]MBT0566909.1 AlkZ family DNA glycosylase [Williamsia sp. CHRR-6]